MMKMKMIMKTAIATLYIDDIYDSNNYSDNDNNYSTVNDKNYSNNDNNNCNCICTKNVDDSKNIMV